VLNQKAIQGNYLKQKFFEKGQDGGYENLLWLSNNQVRDLDHLIPIFGKITYYYLQNFRYKKG